MAKGKGKSNNSPSEPNKRRSLSSAEVNYLWMVSGGICSFEGCNERLVMETDGLLTNQGIIAHIIGHSERSARHEFAADYDYDPNNLEVISNLMLMCYTHSKLIDDHHTRGEFPPDRLFEMKRKHEEWVRSWSEKKKKSIALVHKRLGPPMTSMDFEGEPPTLLISAVENQSEFVDFTPEGWEQAKKENEEIYAKFTSELHKRNAEVAEVFSLSPIPLLIHMGKLVSDTVPLTIYQYDRDKKIWVADSPIDEGEREDLGLSSQIEKRGTKTLVVTISVSETIDYDDVNEIIKEPYDQFDIKIKNPHVKRVLYRQDVQEIQKHFKDKVEELRREEKYRHIHLFYAGPAGLAVELGRSINERMWPEVSLYQFNYRSNPRYHYAFSI